MTADAEPVDPRLTAVVELALGSTIGGHARAVIVAQAVWDWLAGGDPECADCHRLPGQGHTEMCGTRDR